MIKNIKKDYIYIFNLYLNLSKQISKNLNKIHKKTSLTNTGKF